MLKPGFFANDELAELPMATRMLFAGLWTIADREGRLEDRPKRIKGELFRYDDLDIDAMLTALQDSGFIHRYETDGIKCIEIVNFLKHQRPHHNEVASELPPRCKGLSTKDESVSALNLSLEPRTSNLDISLEPSLDNGRLAGEKTTISAKSAAKVKPSDLDQDFHARFYAPYPRHVKRDEGLKAWAKLTPEERDAAADGLQAWLASSAFSPELTFVPNPASWLNGGRWKDDVQAVNPPKPIVWPDWLRKRIDVHLQECAHNKRDPNPYPPDLKRDMDAYLESLRVAA
jgi:hypothetical protein